MERELSQVQIRRPISSSDTETIGLIPKRDRIVELAVKELQITALNDGEAILSFSSLVRPKNCPAEGPRSATRVHGITSRMLQEAPQFRAAWKGFEEHVKNASLGRGRPILVAHNLSFDLGFLKEGLSRLNVALPPWDFADSLRDIAHRVWPGERASLRALVEKLGILNEEAHRALCDVEATEKVIEEADKVLRSRAIEDLSRQKLKPGDFIYSLLSEAAIVRRPRIEYLCRDEAELMNRSIRDSDGTASSVSGVSGETEDTLLSSYETTSEQSDVSPCLEVPADSVRRTNVECPSIARSRTAELVSYSTRKVCTICVVNDAKKPLHSDLEMDNSEHESALSLEASSQEADGERDSSRIVSGPFERMTYVAIGGHCFHSKPNCCGLRAAREIPRAASPSFSRRPCRLCWNR